MVSLVGVFVWFGVLFVLYVWFWLVFVLRYRTGCTWGVALKIITTECEVRCLLTVVLATVETPKITGEYC